MSVLSYFLFLIFVLPLVLQMRSYLQSELLIPDLSHRDPSDMAVATFNPAPSSLQFYGLHGSPWLFFDAIYRSNNSPVQKSDTICAEQELKHGWSLVDENETISLPSSERERNQDPNSHHLPILYFRVRSSWASTPNSARHSAPCQKINSDQRTLLVPSLPTARVVRSPTPLSSNLAVPQLGFQRNRSLKYQRTDHIPRTDSSANTPHFSLFVPATARKVLQL
ncbi:hypothetical protein CPB83DRAFT_899551 [Crepidotus variabilis]|uniref:Uncharacterized protein n=1 Tax=Crepidotus variabilis TaxID=179855 RepID=A0A9P6E512_9AGAR|nr:hypothetical protein CPB83DRAFT_899551 [Crepidotus variabilis]